MNYEPRVKLYDVEFEVNEAEDGFKMTVIYLINALNIDSSVTMNFFQKVR